MQLLNLALLFAAALPAALADSASFAVVRRQSAALALDFPFSTVYRNNSVWECDRYLLRLRGQFPPFELAVVPSPFDAANLSSQAAHVVGNVTNGRYFDDPTLAATLWSVDVPAGEEFAWRIRDAKGGVVYSQQFAVSNFSSATWGGQCWKLHPAPLEQAGPLFGLIFGIMAGVALLIAIIALCCCSNGTAQAAEGQPAQETKQEPKKPKKENTSDSLDSLFELLG
ncbi:hypothetical protein JCM8097_000405 [Rhodosporidiobolus ruineniae]